MPNILREMRNTRAKEAQDAQEGMTRRCTQRALAPWRGAVLMILLIMSVSLDAMHRVAETRERNPRELRGSCATRRAWDPQEKQRNDRSKMRAGESR